MNHSVRKVAIPSTVWLIRLVMVYILAGTSMTSCLRHEQPERFAKFLQASPKIPSPATDTTQINIDTVPIATHRAYVRTNKGAFTIELYGHDAPKTVDNFLALIKRHMYDNILIHRIARNFIIQTGDPKTKDKRKKDEWGTGGESSFGEPFADELNPETPSFHRSYKRGVVAMANRGPNSNTSQFFICLRDVTELPKQQTIFGAVIEGLDVVDSIATEPIIPVLNENDGRPVKPIIIHSIRPVSVLH